MHIARALRATLIGSLYFLMTVKAAVAGPLEDADAADQKGDYETALRLIQIGRASCRERV